MGESILPRRADWLGRVVPPARVALAWSWWAFRHLHRFAFMASAVCFAFLWLGVLANLPGFDPVAANATADLQELGELAAWALATAFDFVVWKLSRLPLTVSVPATLLLLSFPVSALVQWVRASRGRASS
jgi:hypothetical protein